MKSTAQFNGHPIHPMLIPYPFALLTGGAAFDVGARLTGRDAWSQTASHMTTVGLGSALVAALPGIVDYFGTIPRETSAKRTATQHALFNLSALACFAFARAHRDDDQRVSNSGLAAALIGTGLLCMGGVLGGTLIYKEHVGVEGLVEDESPAQLAPSEAVAHQDLQGESRDVLAHGL
jgi:uncharacterized membrane protein